MTQLQIPKLESTKIEQESNLTPSLARNEKALILKPKGTDIDSYEAAVKGYGELINKPNVEEPEIQSYFETFLFYFVED